MVNGALYSPKFKYIAFYCAKSGCSSLRNLFIEMHKKELPEEKQADLSIHTAKESFHVPEDVNRDMVKKFVVVRNPYTRTVSMYMNKFVGPNSHIKRSMREKKIENPIKGECFLSFLQLLKHLKKTNWLNKVDSHVYEQSHGLPESTLVVHLENMEEELLGFYRNSFSTMELFNKASKMFQKNGMHINKTKVKELGIENVTYHEFTEDKCASPPYEAFYNAEAQKLVYEIYHEDFHRFGYSEDLPFE